MYALAQQTHVTRTLVALHVGGNEWAESECQRNVGLKSFATH